MKRLLVGLAVVAVFAAEAFEVKQFFREERFTRGNVNLRNIQPMDDAAWIWLRGVRIESGEGEPMTVPAKTEVRILREGMNEL